MVPQRWIASAALMLTLSASLNADMLFLRDGTRVQGELIAVRNGIIEFPRPDDPTIVRKFTREMTANPPKSVGLKEKGLLS